MKRYSFPGREELTSLADDELEQLASEWRARAGRGDKTAYSVAHALEVELRHRIRSSLLPLAQEPQAKPRPWWKFWRVGPGDGPMSRA